MENNPAEGRNIKRTEAPTQTKTTAKSGGARIPMYSKVEDEFTASQGPYVPQPSLTADTAIVHKWYLLLNLAHPTIIIRTLKIYGHLDSAEEQRATLPCTACQFGKIPGAPYNREIRIAPVGNPRYRDVVGPIYPLGLNEEKYFITFTVLGSRYSIIIPITSRWHVKHVNTGYCTGCTALWYFNDDYLSIQSRTKWGGRGTQ